MTRGSIVALTGPVGCGKTVFAKGLAAALGVDQPITSATFTIIAEYDSSLPLVHADLYRLRDSDEAAAAGLEDYLNRSDTVLIVEWADRAAELFPGDTLWVEIAIDRGGNRSFHIHRGARL